MRLRTFKPSKAHLRVATLAILIVMCTLLKAEYRAWGHDFIGLAQANKAVLEEEPNRWRLSINKLQKAIVKLQGRKKKTAEKLFDRLQNLATNSKGYLARIDRGEDVITLAKPITEASNEE